MPVASEHVPHLSSPLIRWLMLWAFINRGTGEILSSLILIKIVSQDCWSVGGPVGVYVIICLPFHVVLE